MITTTLDKPTPMQFVHIDDDDSNIETFDGGAIRNKTNYRYDLMSPEALTWILPDPMRHLAELLLRITKPGDGHIDDLQLKKALSNVVADGKSSPHLLTLYAEAMHEGASKYGERNWEKGIPIPNLVNHALAHLCKLAEGDTSENHASHLVWNVMTIIHFRQAEQIPNNPKDKAKHVPGNPDEIYTRICDLVKDMPRSVIKEVLGRIVCQGELECQQ